MSQGSRTSLLSVPRPLVVAELVNDLSQCVSAEQVLVRLRSDFVVHRKFKVSHSERIEQGSFKALPRRYILATRARYDMYLDYLNTL